MGKTTQEVLLEQIAKDTTDMMGTRCGTQYIEAGTTYTGEWFALMNIRPGGSKISCSLSISGIEGFPAAGTFTVYSGIPLYGEWKQIRVTDGDWIAFKRCDQTVGI